VPENGEELVTVLSFDDDDDDDDNNNKNNNNNNNNNSLIVPLCILNNRQDTALPL